jgi:hypothetical protein
MSNAKRQSLLDEQMGWKRDEMNREKQERERQSNIQKLLRESFLPTTGPQAIAGDALGPTVGKAQNIGQTPPVNFQQLAAHGVPFERLKALAEAPNLGRSEVARTMEVEGPNGSKMIVQLDKWGKPVAEGMPGYVAPVQINQGDKISMVKPQAGQSFAVGMSPEARDASARGWAYNNLARQRFEFDQRGGAESVNGGKPQFKDGMWVMPPVGMQPGQAISAMQPVAQKDAVEALQLIEQARKVIPQATGSGIGAGVDAVGRFFGKSTEGDQAIGQLQALEGALVAKMPKMSGPQSDKDVLLYKQMAGVVGDPTIPPDRKLAALSQIEEIQRRYAGNAAPARAQSQPNFIYNPATGKLESR